MAHFYSTCRGGRGEASRLGTKNSGIKTTAAGWSSGVTVIGEHDKYDDTFLVLLEEGSASYRLSGLAITYKVVNRQQQVSVNTDFLLAIDESNLIQAAKDSPEFAARLRKLGLLFGVGEGT